MEDTNEICSEVWHDEEFSSGICQDRVWVGFVLSFRDRARRRQDEFLSLENLGAGCQGKFIS